MSAWAGPTVISVAPTPMTNSGQSFGVRIFRFVGNHYLMNGTVTGVAVQWVVSGQPDFTGVNYPGAGGPPTNIIQAAGPF